MTYEETKEALDWLLTTVKEHAGILPLTMNFLEPFKFAFDVAYDEFSNEGKFKEALAELKIKNVDAVTFAMIEHKLVNFEKS